jgi:hypothetical protein
MISAQFKQKLYIHPFDRSKLICFGPNLRKLVQSVDGGRRHLHIDFFRNSALVNQNFRVDRS